VKVTVQHQYSMISSVILAAGLSSRFGAPKALSKLNEFTVIEHIQNTLVGSETSEIIIVIGAHAEEIKPYILKHKKVKFVYNKDYKLGQTSSFKSALQSISSQSQGVLLLPVDYPVIKFATINRLIEHFLKNPPLVQIPTYDGIKGHPPIFNTTLKQEILDLDNIKGINEIAHRHQEGTILVPVNDMGAICSFNTKTEFIELKLKFNKELLNSENIDDTH